MQSDDVNSLIIIEYGSKLPLVNIKLMHLNHRESFSKIVN